MASPYISVQSIIQTIIDFFRNLFGFNKVSQSTISKSIQPSKIINKTTTQTTISRHSIITRTTPISMIITSNPSIKTTKTIVRGISLPPNFNPYTEKLEHEVKGKPIASPYISEINKSKAINIKNIPIVPNVPLLKVISQNRIITAKTHASRLNQRLNTTPSLPYEMHKDLGLPPITYITPKTGLNTQGYKRKTPSTIIVGGRKIAPP